MYSARVTVMDYDEWNELVRKHFNVPDYNVLDWDDYYNDSCVIFSPHPVLMEWDKQMLEEFDEYHGYNMEASLATKMALDGVIPMNNVLMEVSW